MDEYQKAQRNLLEAAKARAKAISQLAAADDALMATIRQIEGLEAQRENLMPVYGSKPVE